VNVVAAKPARVRRAYALALAVVGAVNLALAEARG
jgi:hypothetical protein